MTMHGSTFREEALTGEVRFLRGKTVYERVGDVPLWLATIAVVLMGWRSAPERIRRRARA